MTHWRRWLGRLTGPVGRRLLLALALVAAWLVWALTPPRPRVQWDIPATSIDRCALTANGRVLVVLPQSGMPGLPSGGLPHFDRSDLVQHWDLATGRQRLHVSTRGPNTEVRGFAPDGSWLLVDDRDRLRVLDGATGSERAAFDRWEFAIAPDGRTLAAVDHQRCIVLWDAETGRTTPLFRRRAESPLAFARDGRSFAAFDGPDGDEVAERRPDGLRAYPAPRLDGRSFVRVWDVATGRERAALAVPTCGRAPLLAFGPDGGRLAVYQPLVNDSPAALQVWAVGAAEATAVPMPTLDGIISDHGQGDPAPLEFSPDGRFLALRPLGSRGHLWDLARTPPLSRDDLLADDRTPLLVGGGIVQASPYPIFSPDGRWLLVPGGEPGLVELRPTADVDRRAVLRLRHGAEADRVHFSADGRMLAVAVEPSDAVGDRVHDWLRERLDVPLSAPYRFAVQLFDTDTGAERAAWTVSGYHCGRLLGFGADGRCVWTEVHASDPAQAAGVRAVQFWDETTGRPPAWLLAVTALGVLLAAAGGWRWRRRRGAAAGVGAATS
jgi:WD40 repeat protein